MRPTWTVPTPRPSLAAKAARGGAVDASQLYWTNPVAGTIWAVNLDGSSPHVLATGQDNLAGVAVGGIPGPLLYWANTDGGTVNEANLDGGNPHALFANQNASFGVAVGP